MGSLNKIMIGRTVSIGVKKGLRDSTVLTNPVIWKQNMDME